MLTKATRRILNTISSYLHVSCNDFNNQSRKFYSTHYWILNLFNKNIDKYTWALGKSPPK